MTFCEDVRRISFSRDMMYRDQFAFDTLSNKMVSDVNMLGACVELWVSSESNRGGGIGPELEGMM